MSDIFANSYRPPGIYTEERSPSSANTSVNLGSSVVAIVGPAAGYQSSQQAVVLVGDTPVRLNDLGIDPSSILVTDGSGQIISSDQYAITRESGGDGSPDTRDDVTLIRRNSDSVIPDGAEVVVSYRFTDSSYYTPRAVSDYATVRGIFGNPIGPSGEIASPLSLAARLAFDNGANRMILVAVPGTSESVDIDELEVGLRSLMSFESANIVVPLGVGIGGNNDTPGDVKNLGSVLRNHITESDNVGVRRIGLLGYETTAKLDPADLADDISNKRVGIIWPNTIGYYNSSLGRTDEIGGYYLAAAAAGRLSALPHNTPLTRKQLTGFQGIPSGVAMSMDVNSKNHWGKSGVMVVEANQRGRLIIRHGTSTLTENVFTREISITRAKDLLISSVQASLDAADLIGSPIVAETPVRIKGIVSGVLETMKSNETIIDYLSLDVTQVSLDPSIIEVSFSYRPTYPLNYINIVFSIDPSTGSIAEPGE